MSSNAKNTLLAYDTNFHLHAQTNARAHEKVGSLMITEGSGVWIKDIHGNAYLEAMSGLWYANLGFSNERVIKAINKQLEKLPCYHTFNHRSNDQCAELAQRLATIVPIENAKLFFVNSGSEGIDTMIKMAWYFHAARGDHNRRKIIKRQGAFHGSSIFGAMLSGLSHMQNGFNLPSSDDILEVSCPYAYREAHDGETEDTFCQRLIDEIKITIEQQGAENIAAMIAEPIIGAGGVIIPPKNYFRKLAPLLKKHGILLLLDEVICGFGRTGHWFGAQTFDVKPDMITMAKALTSGYVPMGAVAITDDIYQAIANQSNDYHTFGHGFTYSGHPTAAAAALACLNIYEDINAPQLATDWGGKLKSSLEELADFPIVGDIRCCGFVAGIELVADKKSKSKFNTQQKIGKIFEHNALSEGLIIRNMADTIALCPPLIINEKEFDTMIKKLSSALYKTYKNI
ncbi:MAG: aminotransferase [Ostreibacterium sp.]